MSDLSTLLIGLAIAACVIYAIRLVRKGKQNEDSLVDLLSQALSESYEKDKQLAAIREQRSNGVTYTADQVADWLRNLEAFASIGKITALKITGLWEVKAKVEADKAEKCISCQQAITRDGSIMFVPPEHRLCVRCVIESTISKLEGSECAHLHAPTIGLLIEVLQPNNAPHGYNDSRVYTRKPEGSLLP